VGYAAGANVTTGSNNIEIANSGGSADTGVIRIGLQGTQTQTFIAGIAGSAVTGSDVVINGTGRLGVVVSSARYKHHINDMGSSTDGLMKLRPVTFIYKGDQQGVKQYGLVAEEVAKVYPELVVYDNNGQVQSVRYSMLTSMLLNELKKERTNLTVQTETNEHQASELKQLRTQMIARETATNRQISELKARNELEASRRTPLEQRLAHLEQTIVAQQKNGNVEAAFNQ
jgi:hypothetical protein